MSSFIPLAKPVFGPVEKKLVKQSLDSGWISSLGSFVEQFGREFAAVVGAKYALPVCNGTAALHLALVALGIGKGDEVIVPALTFVASANAVTYVGAKPVFVDIDPSTFNLDLNQVAAKITAKTKAIMSVDLYGHPVDFLKIKALAKKFKLHFISDSAESLGSLYHQKPFGGIADVTTFSFFGNKIVTTGEGGMMVTNSKEIYDAAKFYRDQAKDTRIHNYYHPAIGYNYAMTNLQAAVGIGQLRRLLVLVKNKRAIATRYRKGLKDVPGLSFQTEADYARSNWWMFSILVDKKKFGRSRDELMKYLLAKGIETRPFFYPLPQLPPYRSANRANKFPLTDRIAGQGMNLPTFAGLSLRDQNYIIEQIKRPRVF
jgi:perosamine synthetase